MNKMVITLGAGAAALVSAAVAIAAPGGPHGPRSPQTRAELVQKLDARFAKLDANRDGTVTPAERQAAGEARRAALFDRVDTNKDGSISRAEFAAAGKAWSDRGMQRGGGGRFGGHRGGANGTDANRDGQVTKAEFEARALARFDQADADHDGVVTPEERKQSWASHRGNRG